MLIIRIFYITGIKFLGNLWRSIFTSGVQCGNGVTSAKPHTHVREVDFDELNLLLSQNSIVLVDVRQPHELEKIGKIPGSVNIPRKCIKKLPFLRS